jgi:hypothetical protein
MMPCGTEGTGNVRCRGLPGEPTQKSAYIKSLVSISFFLSHYVLLWTSSSIVPYLVPHSENRFGNTYRRQKNIRRLAGMIADRLAA